MCIKSSKKSNIGVGGETGLEQTHNHYSSSWLATVMLTEQCDLRVKVKLPLLHRPKNMDAVCLVAACHSLATNSAYPRTLKSEQIISDILTFRLVVEHDVFEVICLTWHCASCIVIAPAHIMMLMLMWYVVQFVLALIFENEFLSRENSSCSMPLWHN